MKGLSLLKIMCKKENAGRKGENAGYQHFLIFPQCFQACRKEIAAYKPHLDLLSTKVFLDMAKVSSCCKHKGLN